MERNIVLVTGMSGAGKSSAMNALEDMGFYCMDNFPKELLDQLEGLLNQEEKYANVALSVSALDYLSFANYFENTSHHVEIVFLDCSDNELLLRYRFTRRQHPMIANHLASTLEEAIEMERDLFDSMQDHVRFTMNVDTTKISTQALANRIRDRFKTKERGEFTITFQSFGFKHGIPLDADLVIDVRFLPNPFYEEALREKTGNDKDVYDYVMKAKPTQEFIVRLKDYLDFIFEEYAKQQKSHMIVSIGCTGGQHRSVSICNWCLEQYKDQYTCYKSHRELGD